MIIIIIIIAIMIAMKEQDRSVFYEGDAFLLGFNPYLAPGENQVQLKLLAASRKHLENMWKLYNTHIFCPGTGIGAKGIMYYL